MHCDHAPYCQHKRWTAPDDLTRTTRNWVGGAYDFAVGLASVFRRRERRYPQVAQAAQWASQQVSAPAPAGGLNPNEEMFRPLDRDRDIGATWAFAQTAALPLGGIVLAVAAIIEWSDRWYIGGSVIAVLLVADGLYLWVNQDILRKGLTSPRFTTRQRGPDATPATEPQNVQIDLNADLDKGHGNTQKTRVTVPLSHVRAWRKFCQDVTAGVCKFSGNAAVAHGLDRTWFNGLIARWAGLDPKRALVDPSSVGPRKTLKLTPAGEKRIELDAHAPLPRLMSLLEAMTGTDR